ncbi:trigger factor [Sporanaerobium hydrogeniformans]|uniref:Trigger factor n=1 Tax=Sporanaerobium hydrogeniformans TaxID=3072179 RepID=A0AC61DCF6_9FIRM|nr:trigger factor [Sporanaerobium hydrogeniformans]PHV70356.1 trigger factor [Sporanaerobium hydrogeniformans]
MSTLVEKMEKSQVKITVEVAGEKVTKAIDKAYNAMKGEIKIPGFRNGKVPRTMIEKTYGIEIFFNKAADFLIDETLWDAIEENKIEIAARIRPNELEVVDMTKESMKYTAIITVKPEVTLGDYKGVTIEVEGTKVTEEEVDQAVAAEAEKNAREITVEDRAVEPQDKVTLDFEGFIDGVPFEGGKAEDYSLVIGSKSFIDTFEDQLIGKKIGEESEVNVTFPAEYHVPELAGKPAVFKVVIKGITVKELPEINDDFAADISEFDTLAEYKESIKVKLEKDKEAAKTQQVENKAVETVVSNANIEVPEAMIEEQVDKNVKNFASRMKAQGLELEQYLQFAGQTMDAFRDNFKKDAEMQIKSRLVLEKVGEVENLEVSEEEVETELKTIADMYQMPYEELKKSFGGYEKEALTADLKVQKAAKLIVDSAVVVEK